ncbi:hypothetical protein ABD87_22765 [Lysinibacillus sphaericus]|uniref:hypothetical protein n=1 Tax=Lysinibacillus sphaericus TaxID=1421 RepID=UPI0018CD72DF|nr:hypothetical protein [Lysinibacillus sphaericus]MBG9732250.1 hypothetical protein [Lysinibacillus sphaericus]
MDFIKLENHKQSVLNRTKFVVMVNDVEIGTLYNLNSGIATALRNESRVYRPYTADKRKRAIEYHIDERQLQYIHRSSKGLSLLLQDDVQNGGKVSTEEFNSALHNVMVLRNAIDFCHTFGKKTSYFLNYQKHDIRVLEKKAGLGEAIKAKWSLAEMDTVIDRILLNEKNEDDFNN